MKIKVNSTGTVTYNTEGGINQFDLENMKIKIKGKIEASVIIAVDEKVSVEGLGLVSGVYRTSSSMAKAEIGGKLTVLNRYNIDFSLDVPKGEMAKMYSSSK